MSKIKLYMCGNDDFDIHLEAPDVVLYTNLDYFKKNRTCWRECGIKEMTVDISKYKYVVKPKPRNTK